MLLLLLLLGNLVLPLLLRIFLLSCACRQPGDQRELGALLAE
jgi:hypothetical protein